MNCTYCDTETNGYFEVGRGARLLKITCCEKCYRNLISPLSQDQINIMADAADILVWQDTDCDFEVK